MRIRLPLAAMLMSLGPPTVVLAQIRASEPALVAQTIDGTRMTVEYSRPRARTRDSIFGRVVKWGEVWTPGANMATTLEVSKDVTVNKVAVAKGKYSVWLVVRPSGPWTAVLDPRPKLFHMQHPDSAANQIRFSVTPTAAPFTEALTWSFSGIRGNAVALVLDWGTVRVPLEIEITPSLRLTYPAEQSGPYLGTYSFAWTGGPEAGKAITIVVAHENGYLMGKWDPSPFPEWERFYLISIAADQFVPGFLEKGALFDVERGMVFTFSQLGGRAAAFEVKADDAGVIASGKRIP